MVCGMAWRGEDLVAAGVFHLVPFEPKYTGRTVSEGHWVTRAFVRLTGWLGTESPHLLLCGHWLHSDARGFICDASRVDPAGTLHAMMGKVRRYGRCPLGVEVVKGPDLPDLGGGLAARGYHRVDAAQPTMRLRVDPEWHDWDGYVGGMRKKYRQRARSARKRGASLERERLDVHQVLEYGATLDGLLETVLDTAEVVLAPPRAATLAALKRALGPSLEVVLYRHQGQPVGFAVSFSREDALEGLLVGMAPTANRDFKLYQNILYDFIERAMTEGLPLVELGRTALEIKSAVGAQPRLYPVWSRHHNVVLNWLLGLAAARLRTPAWEPRRAFLIASNSSGLMTQTE